MVNWCLSPPEGPRDFKNAKRYRLKISISVFPRFSQGYVSHPRNISFSQEYMRFRRNPTATKISFSTNDLFASVLGGALGRVPGNA